MCRGWNLSIVTIVAMFALTSQAAAQARSPVDQSAQYRKAHAQRHPYGHPPIGLAYAAGRHGVPHGHGHHYADLVGDPGSGLGFYPLPLKYRIGAWRYRLRNTPPPWDNPVLLAVAADAARYRYDLIPAAGHEYRYGVFSPYDGVGTPFFAGYYGPAGDDDDRPFPFGRPYSH
jgi:hypothetical protein